MRLIGDAEVAQLVTMREAIFAMTAAFEQFGNGAGAIAPRVRASAEHNCEAATISAMGAALPASGVAGANVYTTVQGRFNFVIVLFSSATGEPLAVDAATAAREAEVIATCTRATEPLFEGAVVRPGAFVAAIGSSKPAARELDDALLARADLIVVEWLPAAQSEAGEFVRAAAGVIDPARVVELGKLLVHGTKHERKAADVVVYKSVGVGLEDVALANLVWQRAQQSAAVKRRAALTSSSRPPCAPAGRGATPHSPRCRGAGGRRRPCPGCRRS